MVSNQQSNDIFDDISDVDLGDELNCLMPLRQNAAASSSTFTMPDEVQSVLQGMLTILQQMQTNQQEMQNHQRLMQQQLQMQEQHSSSTQLGTIDNQEKHKDLVRKCESLLGQKSETFNRKRPNGWIGAFKSCSKPMAQSG